MEKIIHQIWVGPYEIPDREKHFISLTKEMHPTFEHKLWTDANLPDVHEELKSKMQVFTERKDFAHVADILRVIVVKMFGGVYIDADFKCLNSMEDWNLEKFNGVIAYHDEYTTGNEFFGCMSNGGYINHLYEDMIETKNLDFMPYWFNKKMKEFFKIESVEDYASEKCRVLGKQLLDIFDGCGIKHMNRNTEFGRFFSHYGLNSWDTFHKKYFEKGDINYADKLYKKPW